MSLGTFAAENAGDRRSSGILAETVASAARPKTLPTKTVTNFSQALRCMDEIFLAFGKKGIYITSAGIPDETGKVRTGTKDMLITAMSTMSAKSGAFEFVDFHGGGDDLARMFEARKDAISRLPDYYIRGAITQMDESVLSVAQGGGISGDFDRGSGANDLLSLSLGASKTKTFDAMGMDMSIADANTRRIIPVTVTANTAVLKKSGKSGDGGNTFGKVGLSFSLDKSQVEGTGAATRALLELSLIETVGKFTQVPYWRCLDDHVTNPLIREQAMASYEKLSAEERVLFVKRKLGGSMNRYKGPIDGVMGPDLAQAISEYQVAARLIASGRVDFDLYASLLDDVQNSLAALPPESGQAPASSGPGK